MAVDAVLNKAFRKVVLDTQVRSDGRGVDVLRNIASEVDVLPVVHGSAYFQRGDTHVICTTTLGPKQDAKVVSAPVDGSGTLNRIILLLLKIYISNNYHVW